MTYEELRRRHVRDATVMLPEHLERLQWSRERLDAHRRAALRSLVRAAISRSPWHRRRLDGVEVDHLDETTLSELPAMTKADLMDNFDEIVTDDRLRLDAVNAHIAGLTEDAYLLGRYHAIASGGSTGRRGVFVYDWGEWTEFYLGLLRYELAAQERERPHRGARPLHLAAVAAGRASHASRAVFQTFARPDLVTHGVPITLPIGEIVARLNEIRPDVLVAYPSALLPLAAEARAGRLTIRPRRISVGAEPLLPEIRATAEDTWGVPVINVYGASEGGGLAMSCGQGRGLHLAEDQHIIEPVDRDGRPVRPAERSAKIYLTTLYNHTLPLIRYEVTDEVRLIDDGPCPCGSAHRRIEEPQGRLDDAFVYGPVTVHPLVFRSALGLCQEIVEYQVRQTDRGADISVRTQGATLRPGAVAGLEAEIAAKLAALGVEAPEVRIMAVERLERQDTGKLKRFLPLPPPVPGGTRRPATTWFEELTGAKAAPAPA